MAELSTTGVALAVSENSIAAKVEAIIERRMGFPLPPRIVAAWDGAGRNRHHQLECGIWQTEMSGDPNCMLCFRVAIFQRNIW
jgi:hypothetical protein